MANSKLQMANGKLQMAVALFEGGCIQFGSFVLKSGLTSPIYVDLRQLVSHPALLRETARAMAAVAQNLTFDCIAAIPYAGLPIGTALALEMERPLIYPRQDAKTHGIRRAIEGTFQAGETALIVDDVITRGDSKLETIAPLEEAGLVVRDVLVLVDREQGGADDLARRGYSLHAILKLSEVMESLREADRVTPAQYTEVMAYLKNG